jgi:hypothetical protein
MGVVEAVNGNIKSLLRRRRGYQNLHYLLLKSLTDSRDQDRIRRLQKKRLRMPSSTQTENPKSIGRKQAGGIERQGMFGSSLARNRTFRILLTTRRIQLRRNHLVSGHLHQADYPK